MSGSGRRMRTSACSNSRTSRWTWRVYPPGGSGLHTLCPLWVDQRVSCPRLTALEARHEKVLQDCPPSVQQLGPNGFASSIHRRMGSGKKCGPSQRSRATGRPGRAEAFAGGIGKQGIGRSGSSACRDHPARRADGWSVSLSPGGKARALSLEESDTRERNAREQAWLVPDVFLGQLGREDYGAPHDV